MYLIGVFYFFRAYNYKSYKYTCNTCNCLPLLTTGSHGKN